MLLVSLAPSISDRNPPMNQSLALGVLRHIVQLGAGALVARGLLDDGSAELLTGAVVSLGTVGWYVIEKRRGVTP